MMRKLTVLFLILILCEVQAQTFTHKFLPQTSDTRSITIGDLDNNSYPDLFFSNMGTATNELYMNWGDTLIKITTGLGANNNHTNASAIGDVNNDCSLDIVLANGGGGFTGIQQQNTFYSNSPYGQFSLLASGLTQTSRYSTSAAWADYDKDGDLDVYITNTNSQNNQLFRNDGSNTFTAITGQTLVTDGDDGSGSQWVDFDNDDDADLFVTNSQGENNLLFRQDSAGYFTKITTGSMVNDGGNSFSGSWGDYNNDGHMDLFVANSGNGVNFLYTNNGNGTFTKVTNINVVTTNSYSVGSAWGDINNDGYQDLIVGNGRTLSGSVNANFIYINNGDSTFTKLNSGVIATDWHSTTAVAIVDINRDGHLDVIQASRNQGNDVYLNDGNNNSFFSCELQGDISNKSALGAKVKLKADLDGNGNPTWQYRELMSASGSGQSGFDMHFGVKSATNIDSLVISWPSGQQCIFTNLAVNGYFHIKESNCTIDSMMAADFADTSSYLRATFSDMSKGPVTRFHWDFGETGSTADTSNLANPSYTYSQPGTYKVCLYTYDDFCKWDSVCTFIEICPDTSTLGFVDTHNSLALTFTDTSSSTAYDFSWDFGDSSPTANGAVVNHTYAQAGTYNVCLTLTDSCRTKTLCRTITVCNDTLLANFGTNQNGLTVNFNDSSTNASGISWDFGDGNSSTNQNPSHTYAAPGYYIVCQTAQDACTSTTFCDTIGVCLDTAMAGFTVSSSGQVYSFTDTSLHADTYLWDFGDGNLSTNQNPSHIFSGFGTYKVCLTITNDCYTDSVCQMVNVCSAQGTAAFTYQNSVAPLAIQFLSQSVNAVSYYWDFGDGSFSTNKNPLTVFADPIVYNVCLTITDSCGLQDSTCQTVDLTTFSTEEWMWLNALKVYPNPSQGIVFIESGHRMENEVTVELSTITGQRIIRKVYPGNEEKIELNLSSLAEGLYLVKIITGAEQRTVKINKQ